MKILVIGETCIDTFIYGSVNRICPEGPVPILEESYSNTTKGMATNVYNNLNNIINHLGLKFETSLITNTEYSQKTRYVDSDSNQLILRVDTDSREHIKMRDLLNINFSQFDAVIVSDYDKGFLSDDDLKYIALKSKLSFLDTKKKCCLSWAEKFDFIKINEKEYRENGFIKDSNYLKKKLIVTQGARGCSFNGEKFPLEKQVEVRDVSGAGDTFLAAIVPNYLYLHSMYRAIRTANDYCGIVVSKKGVSLPFPDEA